jgi:hypothetical protein
MLPPNPTTYYRPRQLAPGEYRALKVEGQCAAATPIGQPPATDGGRRRCRRPKPVYRSIRAFLKAKRKQHNRRRWAAIGKIAAPKSKGGRSRPKP